MKKVLTLLLIIGVTFIFTPYPFAIAAGWHFPDTGKFAQIQELIDDPNVLDGDSIILAPGIYYENIDFSGKSITLRSIEPGDPNVVAATIIDGSQAGSVVYFNNEEDPNSVLSGMTIRNGKASYGGGIFCSFSSPSIINCLIISNSSDSPFLGGGAIYCSSSTPSIINCTIKGNSADVSGGGIFCSSSTPSIINCTINGNSADFSGGGIYCGDASSPIFTNCIISGNTSKYGGGIRCAYSSSPVFTNCTISGNKADNLGGGIYCYSSLPTITNCILWNDSPDEIYEVASDLNVTYCCIQNEVYAGESNINISPLFVDPNGGDYHLQSGSPCIDKGTNMAVPSEDKDGVVRPKDGNDDGLAICDIGVYEYFQLPVLWPGLNLVSFPRGLENQCSTVLCVVNQLIDQNFTLFKMQTYLAEQSRWVTLADSYEGDMSFIFDNAWLVYITHKSDAINVNVLSIDNPLEIVPGIGLFPGLNMLDFYSLFEVINNEGQQLTWPQDYFQRFYQETGEESTGILGYDAHKGKWRAKYQFFGQTAGPESKAKKKGYMVYLQ